MRTAKIIIPTPPKRGIIGILHMQTFFSRKTRPAIPGNIERLDPICTPYSVRIVSPMLFSLILGFYSLTTSRFSMNGPLAPTEALCRVLKKQL